MSGGCAKWNLEKFLRARESIGLTRDAVSAYSWKEMRELDLEFFGVHFHPHPKRCAKFDGYIVLSADS